jgi:anti-sigma regulatory factor (Ser/Thr protein kinase)
MRIESEERGGWLDCRFSGSSGFSAYDAFGEVLSRFTLSPVEGLRIDLTQLASLDSLTLGMLRVAQAEATRLGRQFELTGASGDVEQVFRLAADAEGAPEHQKELQPVLLTDDDPGQDFLTLCASRRIDAASANVFAPDGRPAILYGLAAEETIHKGLGAPYSGYVEQDSDGVTGIGARCLNAVRAGGIALSVRTGTAFTLELPQMFEAAIRQRYPLGKRASDGLILLCLAEAVSNAVIHGNLGIASGMRATREGFRQFQQTMKERLADPSLARRRLEVSLHPSGPASFTLAVSDRGNGFDFEAQLAKCPQGNDKQGRGLPLIRKSARSVYAEDGGRTIVMGF